MNLHIRPAAINDFSAVLTLIAPQLTADFRGITFTAADLTARWQTLTLETDTWLALRADGTAVAYLDLTDNRTMPLLFLANTAAADVGVHLLQLAGASVVSGGSLIAQISESNQTLQHVYARAGYQRGLTFSNMEIVMTSPPPPPYWPEGIVVRPYDPDKDAYATYVADEEASQDKGYHRPLSFTEWRQRLRLVQDDFDPAWWFLAWAGAEIAGVSLGLAVHGLNTGWIDHLGVRRPYRRQGLGKALLRHSFAHFYRGGFKKVMLNVDSASLTNAPRLYESVGMQTVQAYHIYRKTV